MSALLKNNLTLIGRTSPTSPRRHEPGRASSGTRVTPPSGSVPPVAQVIFITRSQEGVALVITLIMLAVITFMAITFLAIARREKGQVATTTDQTIARFTSESGQAQAGARIIASILATTNVYAFDLLASTNFINLNGFDPAAADGRTNVNFDYQDNAAHSPLTQPQQLQNFANLVYSPRAPVFITNRFSGSNEFRFYLDLNRDGRYTPNGTWPVTNNLGQVVISNNVIVSNYFVGDPEFIGVLERPNFPHSPTNRFLARFAYLVVAAGKTLDLNYLHNHAKSWSSGAKKSVQNGFFRNQGVGTWEINLAAFLRDLNTNAWDGYQYFTNTTSSSGGVAFDDAESISYYRHKGDVPKLASVRTLFGLPGVNAFLANGWDGYSAGPLMTDYRGLNGSPAADSGRTSSEWPGADSPNHFFTTQELFDRAKVGFGVGGGNTFADRMLRATTNSPSSYDRYTFYRLLAQLGTDSAPEPPSKMNLNYDNLVRSNPQTGTISATNFYPWEATAFFTNAADRLVRRYSEEWRDLNYRSYASLSTYTNTFGTDQTFGASRIPVFVNGRFVYSPSLHRQLQLAANLWDAVHGKPNDLLRGPLPTVFRPRFTNDAGNIYIKDFKEVTRYSDIQGLTIRDLADTNIVASVQPDDLLFGVPLIIGARQGLPNFNEFSSEAVISVTRKVELRRSVLNGPINQTNQMFVIGISNVFGAEFWNSYTKLYQRPVEVLVTNYCTLSLTNDFAYTHRSNLVAYGVTNLTTWPAWKPNITRPQGPWSFLVPLRTNHIIVPDSTYRHSTASFIPITGTFESPQPKEMWFPRWGLTITNRLLAIIKEPGANGRIIDYVQLNSIISHRNFSSDLAESPLDRRYVDKGIYGVWATNSPDGLHLGDYPGIDKQVRISMGDVLSEKDWMNNTANLQSGATKYQAIADFLYFMKKESHYDADGKSYFGTNTGNGLVATVPFSPTSKRSIPITYQANDPLVHYTTGDMEYLEKSGLVDPWTPPNLARETLPNLGKLNARYRPWGNYPNSPEDDKLVFQTVVKDPGVTKSGDWQFPTNKLPTLGWMGRIHRGTPWQTVYLKSSRVADSRSKAVDRVSLTDWQNWTGNRNVWTDRNGKFPLLDPWMTQPETDRAYLDLFTTALDDNATRGQLPINQSGLAAWSAVFGGMVALTNATPDDELINNGAPTGFEPAIIDPAGAYDPADAKTWGAMVKIVQGINNTRTNRFSDHTFRRLGDLLDTPELTEASPFLNLSPVQKEKGVNDAVYEWLPQQMLSLVRLGQPRFVIYSFGQTLKPAPGAIQLSGPYFGMATNYQITAEVATRAVVRMDGSPDPRYTNDTVYPYPDPRGRWILDPKTGQFYPPRIVVENFNVLPPD